MRSLAPFFRRQILVQRRLFQAADAAEKVQLIGRHAQANGIEVGRAGRPRSVKDTANARKLIGPLDLVLRAGLFDVEHGHAQIAVVGQRLVNQALESGV